MCFWIHLVSILSNSNQTSTFGASGNCHKYSTFSNIYSKLFYSERGSDQIRTSLSTLIFWRSGNICHWKRYRPLRRIFLPCHNSVNLTTQPNLHISCNNHTSQHQIAQRAHLNILPFSFHGYSHGPCFTLYSRLNVFLLKLQLS